MVQPNVPGAESAFKSQLMKAQSPIVRRLSMHRQTLDAAMTTPPLWQIVIGTPFGCAAARRSARACRPITPQYLLEGAVYALEQCGLLLRDANLLYRSGSYATAVALAAFAREEQGRWRILLELRREVLDGKSVMIEEITIAVTIM
jgi:AbiV